MPKIESMIKYINKKLADFRNYYGEKSYHYQKLASVLFNIENIPTYQSNFKSEGIWGKQSVALSTEHSKPIRIIRKKEFLNVFDVNDVAFQELQAIYEFYKEYGTVRQTALKTISELEDDKSIIVDHKEIKGRELEIYQKILRELSYTRYLEEFQDDDLYLVAENMDELFEKEIEKSFDEQDIEFLNDLTNARAIFRRSGKGIKEQKKDDILKAFEKAKEEHQKRLKEKLGVSKDNEDNAPAPANPYKMSF